MNEVWAQILAIMVGNFGIIWWFRKECREDWKMCNGTIEAIRIEMKDFHEKLLKIEMDREKQ